MQNITLDNISQVIGGTTCSLHYEIQASAIYLPFISQYFMNLQTNQITATQFLQALNSTGLNPNNVVFNTTVTCS